MCSYEYSRFVCLKIIDGILLIVELSRARAFQCWVIWCWHKAIIRYNFVSRNVGTLATRCRSGMSLCKRVSHWKYTKQLNSCRLKFIWNLESENHICNVMIVTCHFHSSHSNFSFSFYEKGCVPSFIFILPFWYVIL